jgi:PPOX class probable F420-dependent enzyme
VHIEEALEFVRTNHRCVIATARKDGSTQMSPVVAAVDDDGSVVVSSRETAMKTSHVRRTGRSALCVFTEGFFGRWVQVEGPTEVVSLPEAMEGLISYYRQISGEHPNWDEYRAAMRSEQRVLLRMTVERAGPDRSGWTTERDTHCERFTRYFSFV